MKAYDHGKIEKKWQKEWEEKKVYKTLSAKSAALKKQKPFYVLDMFPYPSGAGLHVGHPRGYIGSDVIARQKRMQGFNVLHPMGYDAFGLPAEQYAIANKIHPRKAVEKNVATFEKQLSIMGLSFDWSRKINTTDPGYYKWTQWIFLKIYDSWFDTVKNAARPIAELVSLFEKSGTEKVQAWTTNTKNFSAKEWKAMSELEQQAVLMHYRLAYEGYSEVNWCPELGTVLANDEIVDGPTGPVSERGGYPVEKKTMRQWFMRITAYGERLLEGLDMLDWPEHIKDIERNWIGKSEGAEIDFNIVFTKNPVDNIHWSSDGKPARVSIFTTRADTLFGATYLVLAPEHTLVWMLLKTNAEHDVLLNKEEIKKYIETIKNRTDIERSALGKEKTGVELKGVKAINPATKEEIPIYIADYVLPQYGTGAIMAVPAHDERDFLFAKKFRLPVVQVVSKKYILTGEDAERQDVETLHRKVVDPFIRDNEGNFYLIKEDGKHIHFAGGGVEKGETDIEALAREIKEETGFVDFQILREISPAVTCWGYRHTKNKNQRTIGPAYEVVLNSLKRIDSEVEEGRHELIKVKKEDVLKKLTWEHHKFLFERYLHGDGAYEEEGVLYNSGVFDGMTSEFARTKIIESINGRIVTKYKFRDAVFARQRYWGEPIPLQKDAEGMLREVPEKKLPLELPNVKSYEPTGTGESPLGAVGAWTKAGYETNTMPGWAGSSWYFLRYTDPHYKKAFASEDELSYWFNKKKMGGVDMYIGGAEHATGHVLYARFWHKVLFDLGFVDTPEPFNIWRSQGMILAADGRKMSKRWGNVVNPDEVVKTYGADTLRLYEMFIGPFFQSANWSTESIIGPRRFIERVWRLQEKVTDAKIKNPAYEQVLHQTIKKVTEDIESLSFNTAVSQMMICLNEMEKSETVAREDFKKYLQVLAPFAPHVTEELWQMLGEKKSIHVSGWPKFDPKKLLSETMTIMISVNGKVRGQITVARDAKEEDITQRAVKEERVAQSLNGLVPKRVIYVPGRLVNIVV